jgi:hypothetical protein
MGVRNLLLNAVADVVDVTAAGGTATYVQTYPKPWLATCGQEVMVLGVMLM